MNRFFRLQEGWITVGLLALLLFSVTLSIQQAQWADGLVILTPITLIGLGSGILFAKMRGVPRILLDLVGLELGILTVLLAVASIMTDSRLVTIQDRTQELIARTGGWIALAVRGQSSDDLLVFILSLALVCWVLAYSSAYFVFKSRQLWWALVPNGVALLINLSYSAVNLRAYIIVFMFSALLLMVRFNLLVQEERWQRERINYSPTLTWAFLWAGSLVSVVLAVAMWYVPATQVNTSWNEWWNQVNKPWRDFEDKMSNMFPDLPGNRSIGGYSSFGDGFRMGGALNLSDSIAMEVKSRERLYWRAKTYDDYDGKGWKNTAASTLTVLPNSSSKLSLEANQQLISEDDARKTVTYTITMRHPKEDVLFAVSRPIRLSVASRLNVAWRKLNDVYPVEDANTGSVPPDMRPLMGIVRQAQHELRTGTPDQSLDPVQQLYATSVGAKIRDQVENLDKRGLKITFDVTGDPFYVIDLRASGEVPVYDDLTSVHAMSGVPANMQYTVTSLVSEAKPDDLRQAGTNYEQWVNERYLNLPATVPQRVRDKAQEIVDSQGATNPYDKAKAIEAYLRSDNFTYSTNIPLPPSGVENADWFLFQSKTGYCEYYATAMLVMVRSLGIPARMAAGYAPGQYDAAKDAYVVRESSAHTWPELYFPGYGWIEFEPTPSQLASTQGIIPDTPPAQPSPSSRPQASPTQDEQKDLRATPRALPPTQGSTGIQGPTGFGWWLAALVVIMVLVAVFTWLVPVLPWARKERRVGTAGEYYTRMIRMARWLGLGPASHQTPFEFSESVAREVPGTSAFTRSIARSYVRERFSRSELDMSDRVAALRAWDSLRGRFLRMLPLRQFKRTRRRR
jgi:transglutaminase-like putative cysteine protease